MRYWTPTMIAYKWRFFPFKLRFWDWVHMFLDPRLLPTSSLFWLFIALLLSPLTWYRSLCLLYCSGHWNTSLSNVRDCQFVTFNSIVGYCSWGSQWQTFSNTRLPQPMARFSFFWTNSFTLLPSNTAFSSRSAEVSHWSMFIS